MKSYEEMAQNVFKRGDEYFRIRRKRSARIKKGVSFMSILGIFTLVGLGLLSSDNVNQVIPDDTSQIAIVETETATDSSTTKTTDTHTQTNTTTAKSFVTSSTAPATSVTSKTAPPLKTTASRSNMTSMQKIIGNANDVITTEITPAYTETKTVTTTINTTNTTTSSSIPNIGSISTTKNCIISKLAPGTGFDSITYYRGFTEAHPIYLWSTEATNFYAVTAETYEEINNFKLPSGAERVDLSAPGRIAPSWSVIEQKYCLDELTDPYIIVSCNNSEALYLMENVKAVYQLEQLICTEAKTVEGSNMHYVTVLSSKDISITEIGNLSIPNEDIVIRDIQKISELENGQKEYRIYFDKLLNAAINCEASVIRHFDICQKLMEFDFIDTAYPSFMSPEDLPSITYPLTLMNNPYLSDINTSGTFGEGFSWTLNGDTLTFSANEAVAGSNEVILTTGSDESAVASMPWNRYRPHIKHIVFSDEITSLGDDFDSYFMNTDMNLETITNGERFDWLKNAVLYGEKLRFEATFVAPKYSKTDWLTYLSDAAFVEKGIAEDPFINPGNESAAWEYSEQDRIVKLRGELTNDSINTAAMWYKRFDCLILEKGTRCLNESVMSDLIQLTVKGNKDELVPVYCYPDFGYDNINQLRSNGITVIVMDENNSPYKGDINFDGTVDMDDATSVLNYYAYTTAGLDYSFAEDEELNKFACYAANTNTSITRTYQNPNISDATNILAYYAQETAGLNPSWDSITNK